MYSFSESAVRTSQGSDLVPGLQEALGKIISLESTENVVLYSGLQEKYNLTPIPRGKIIPMEASPGSEFGERSISFGAPSFKIC